MTQNNVDKVESSSGVKEKEDSSVCAKKVLTLAAFFVFIVFFLVACSVRDSVKDLSSILAVIFGLFSVLSIFITVYEKDPIFEKGIDGFVVCVGYGFLGACFGLTSYAKGLFLGRELIDILFHTSLILSFLFQFVVLYLSLSHNSKNKDKNLSYGVYLLFFIISAGIFVLCLIFIGVLIYFGK